MVTLLFYSDLILFQRYPHTCGDQSKEKRKIIKCHTALYSCKNIFHREQKQNIVATATIF